MPEIQLPSEYGAILRGSKKNFKRLLSCIEKNNFSSLSDIAKALNDCHIRLIRIN